MATQSDVEAMARSSRDLRALALRELRQIWDSADASNPVGIRALVEEMMPPLVEKYGEVAATAAADFYDEVRLEAGVRGPFSARLADPVPDEAVRASSRWAIDPVFSPTADEQLALGRLAQVLDRMVLQQGQDTIVASVVADPVRVGYARIPQGDDPCAFCLTMASRGAVYLSRSTASVVGEGRGTGGPRGFIPPGFGSRGSRRSRPRGEAYHADCGCVATPIFEGQGYPSGYNPDALYEKYNQARAEARSGDLRDILSEMRSQQGIN